MKTVIIGAGPAGVTVAETLREHDDCSEIIMISGEPYPPYSPPAMVEYFLTGNPVHFWKGEDFPDRLHLDYRAGLRVLAVKPEQKLLLLDGGEELAYDRLVVAAGGRLYAPLDGSDKEGIHNFKSLQAGEVLLARVKEKAVRTALIVGAGFIGVEIALLLKEMGLEVTMLVRSRVMRLMLDPETSLYVQDLLAERGVAIIQGDDADATAFLGDERAVAVQMRSGKELRADLLVAATGLKPNLELVHGFGLETDWGILVDPHLRTNYADIYAAGDIAETIDRISGARYAHANYPNAVTQGRIVGLNLLGHQIAYEGSDSMNSLRHIGLPVMAAGMMEGEELVVRRNGTLRKLWLKEGRLVGFRLAGDLTGAGIYLALMRRAVKLDSVQDNLLKPGFGMAHLTAMALDPALNIVREL